MPSSNPHRNPTLNTNPSPFYQPRFKLHTATITSSTPIATTTATAPAPPTTPPKLNLHHSPPPTNSVTPNLPITHLVSCYPLILASSPNILSVWRLHPSYPAHSPTSSPTSRPLCTLQSQWLPPQHYIITYLAVAPDVSVLLLLLRQQNPPPASQPTSALVLLRPSDCALLIRLSLPPTFRLPPHPTTSPSATHYITFISSSPSPTFPSHPIPSRPEHLSPHLRHAFNINCENPTLDAPFSPALALDVAPAPYAVAVSGSDGPIAVYRFTSGYKCLLSHNLLNIAQFFTRTPLLRMSPVPHLAPTPHANQTFGLALCTDHSAVLLQDAMPASPIALQACRPLAICAFRWPAPGEMSAVILVLRDPAAGGKPAKLGCEARLAFAVASAQRVVQFSPVRGVYERDVDNVHVLREDMHSAIVILQCTTQLLCYRISVNASGAFRVAEANTDNGFTDVRTDKEVRYESLLRVGDHIVGANTDGSTVVLDPLIRRRFGP